MADLQTTGLSLLKGILNNEKMKANFENVLHNNAESFMTSIITLYQSDALLQKCDPNKVVTEAYKAAALGLPISKNFGYCYIIPYGSTPAFQMGYKGWLQLAIRSNEYLSITADAVYEGEVPTYNRVTDEFSLDGAATSDNAIGYFARFELKGGFHKAIYWPKERVIAHAKRYSQAYKAGKKDSPWFTAFDSMAIKTVLMQILTRYGIMSPTMQRAYEQETDDRVEAEVAEQANRQEVTISTEFVEPPEAAPEPQDEGEEVPF